MIYLKEKMMYNDLTNNDYERIQYLKEEHNIDHDSFRILTGKWAGVIVTYGNIALTKPADADDSEAKLKFNYIVNETNGHVEKDLTTDPDFNNFIGDMLTHCIDEALQENNFAIGDKNESTNDYTEESNQ